MHARIKRTGIGTPRHPPPSLAIQKQFTLEKSQLWSRNASVAATTPHQDRNTACLRTAQKDTCRRSTSMPKPPKRTNDVCPAGWSHTALLIHLRAIKLTRCPQAESPSSLAAVAYSSNAYG